jgi:glycosyltransferase involved in cell wall biosynthesis
MKVLHVIPSIAPVHGGPSAALPVMAAALERAGVDVDVVTTDDAGPGRRFAGIGSGWVDESWGRCRYFPKQTDFYKVSVPMLLWLLRHVPDYDAVHVHGLFSFPSTAGAFAARVRGVRYFVRPLGVLNQWGLRNRRRWLKRVSMELLELRLLAGATAVQYTTRQEEMEARLSGVSARGVVVPLGLDLETYRPCREPEDFGVFFPQLSGSRVVLFLSRLDRKKGLEVLLEAFARLRTGEPDVRLLVAGDGEPAYVESLMRRAETLGLGETILWAGFLEGSAKIAALQGARVYCLPSYSENFGIAAVEAMACGIPCVFTPGVGIAREAELAGAALVVPAESRRLEEALGSLLRSPRRAMEMGEQARWMVEREYSMAGMGAGLKAMYCGENLGEVPA